MNSPSFTPLVIVNYETRGLSGIRLKVLVELKVNGLSIHCRNYPNIF